MQKLTTIEEFHSLTTEEKVIFFFTADWCSDCNFIKPFIPEIVEDHPEIQFIEVDRDQFLDLCGDLAVFGIPNFIAFENGHEVGRFVSKDRKTKTEIEAFIQSLDNLE